MPTQKNTPFPRTHKQILSKYDGKATRYKDQKLSKYDWQPPICTDCHAFKYIPCHIKNSTYATNPAPHYLRLTKYVRSYHLGIMDTRVHNDGADKAFLATLIPVWEIRLMNAIHI